MNISILIHSASHFDRKDILALKITAAYEEYMCAQFNYLLISEHRPLKCSRQTKCTYRSYSKVRPVLVEYKLQNTKTQNPQYFFDYFRFVQVQNRRKRQNSAIILSFSRRNTVDFGFWIFVICTPLGPAYSKPVRKKITKPYLWKNRWFFIWFAEVAFEADARALLQ